MSVHCAVWRCGSVGAFYGEQQFRVSSVKIKSRISTFPN